MAHQWRLVIDGGDWLRLFDESDYVVETCLATGDVADVVARLAPGDTIAVFGGEDPIPEESASIHNDDGSAGDAPPNPHQCAGGELRASRLQLALLSNDLDTYTLIAAEVGGCARCWRHIADWTLGLLAGDRALRAGGVEAAAGFIESELIRMMPHE
jgi:hypothetical protein